MCLIEKNKIKSTSLKFDLNSDYMFCLTDASRNMNETAKAPEKNQYDISHRTDGQI